MVCRAVTTIRNESMRVIGAQKATMCVDTVADVADSLSATFFLMDSPSATDYYVWIDTGSSVDPAVASRTGIQVTVATDASAATIATAMAAAITAIGDFIALVPSTQPSRVIIKTATYEDMALPVDGAAPTGFTFAKSNSGFELDFGSTDGDIELTVNQTLQDITAHQTGSQPITALVNGVAPEVAIAIKEFSEANLTRIVDLTTGGTHTPAGGTAMRGYGTAQTGTNIADKAFRLVLHPTRLVSTDHSDDYCLYLAYPLPSSFTFSGESEALLNTTFRGIPDEFVDSEINSISEGDHTQV